MSPLIADILQQINLLPLTEQTKILRQLEQKIEATTAHTSESISLLITYHNKPNILVRNKLVLLNSGLVRQVAHRLSRQCVETYQDLEQIGYLGLIRAIERFNPHQGCAFSSFAVPYIRGEILHFLRDRGSSALSNPVNTSQQQWQQAVDRIHNQTPISLDQQRSRVAEMFTRFNDDDDEKDQQEALEIISSIAKISI